MKEELNALKEGVEAVNGKLQELTEEEIAQVNGGLAVVLTGGGITYMGGYPYAGLSSDAMEHPERPER